MRGSKQNFPTYFHKSNSIPVKNENVRSQEKREDYWKKIKTLACSGFGGKYGVD